MPTIDVAAGRFSVAFPGQPHASANTVRSRSGTMTEHRQTLELQTGTFDLTWWDFPDNVDTSAGGEATFDRFRDMLASIIEGKITADAPVSLHGAIGRDVRIESPQGFMRAARMVILGSTYYQLAFTGPQSELDGPVVRAFFDSLRPIDAAAPGH